MSLGLVAVGAILWVFLNPIIGAGLVLGGTIMTITGLYAATKPEDYFRGDERTARINEKAGLNAFLIVMETIIILDIFEIVIPGTIIYKDASVVILYMGIYSFILFWWFYNKKGDIE